jgi:hypothetical protein
MSALLFDIVHPAHVHLFKNVIRHFQGKGHRVVVISRAKDVANVLLEHYHIGFLSLSRAASRPRDMLLELLRRDLGVLKLHRRHNFSSAFGTSASIAHLSAVSRVKSFVFEMDDDDVVPLFAKLAYPFATGIVVPASLRYKKWREKRIVHDSYHELAYLHPDQFSPDPDVLKRYGLKPHGYIVVRKSALKAHHDLKAQGFEGPIMESVLDIIKPFPVVSSWEGEGRSSIEPWDMHDILAFAKLVISDSQTMTRESAVLGTPSIRVNSFVGKLSCFDELENKFGLTFGFRPGDEPKILDTIRGLLGRGDLAEEWQEKRKRLLAEKPNFLKWITDTFDFKI